MRTYSIHAIGEPVPPQGVPASRLLGVNMLDRCPPCRANLHEECHSDDPDLACCCPRKDEAPMAGLGTLGQKFRESLGNGKAHRTLKDDADVKDQTSVGRKRAVLMFPVSDGMVCEWAHLKFAGGGAIPIVGCEGTILYREKGKSAVHHGPDKSTLNNVVGNVHRICVSCHNRWHTLNDPYYPATRPDAGEPFVPLSGVSSPHDPETQADAGDYEYSNKYWSVPLKVRENLPYRKPDTTTGLD